MGITSSPSRLGAALFLLLAAAIAAPAQTRQIPCVVKVVTDGDTIRCADDRRVRLLQVDAPERDQRPTGPAARLALLRLAPPGTAVQLETDRRRTDQYGRTLAFVWLPDGRMANEELARTGNVVLLVYKPNVKYVDRITKAIDAARREKLGVWADGAPPCEPRDHRQHRC